MKKASTKRSWQEVDLEEKKKKNKTNLSEEGWTAFTESQLSIQFIDNCLFFLFVFRSEVRIFLRARHTTIDTV